MTLLAEHEEASLATKKRWQPSPSKSLTSTPKNRVWDFENTPSGRPSVDPDLSWENATSSVHFTHENASGRAEWLSRDPIGENGGINLYGYVGNDPEDQVDQWGLCPGDPPPGIPNPPPKLPGGPYTWTPNTPGGGNPRSGDFNGPPQPSGPRWRATPVPPGPNNPNPYWKVTPPGGPVQRYDANGNPISPEEAHPGPPQSCPSPSGSGPSFIGIFGPVGFAIWFTGVELELEGYGGDGGA